MSQIEHWRLYPFPAQGVVERAVVYPQDYTCVGNDSALWTFHLDTFVYTEGCTLPPSIKDSAGRPCDEFLYVFTVTSPPLYTTYGRAFACAMYGRTVVGVVHGASPAGVVVCDPPDETSPPGGAITVFDDETYCGLLPGRDPVPLSERWPFVPLPVAAADVDSATFDTSAGTACLRAAGQSFTFTLATRAFNPGCAAP